MEKHTLKAEKRTLKGRKVKSLRKQGLLPGNIYGKSVSSQTVQVSLKEFVGIFAKVGETGLIDLIVDGKDVPVLIHNVQYHPVTQQPLHADFYHVNLKEKILANIPIVVKGESPAVRDKLGVLLTILSEVEVEALPTDLPEHIEIDISRLTEIDQTIKVSDLSVPRNVKILSDLKSEIVKIAPLISKEAEQLAKEEKEASAAAQAAQTPKEEQESKESIPQETKEPAKEEK